MSTVQKKPLACNACRRSLGKAGTIECRSCGRMGCKHFLVSITDQDGKQFDPIRDPKPQKMLGTCTACRVKEALS